MRADPRRPAATASGARLAVARPEDVARARRMAYALAVAVGLGAADAAAVALAATELATNLVRYARGGALTAAPVAGPRGRGVQLESRDVGPGIPELARALQDGYSTGGGLGGGLPGVRRLMDEFAATSGPGGTTIVARKWAGATRRAGAPRP